MKKAFHNIAAITMALLVLVSTASFTVDKHFCGKVLVDMSILSEADTCGMELHEATNMHSASQEEGGVCCSNKKTSVEGQDELKVSFESLDFEKQLFLSSFTYSYLNLFRGMPAQKVPFINYSPPLLVTDIQVLDQVFLI